MSDITNGKSQEKKDQIGWERPHFSAVNPPKSFVGSLPPFTVAEKRAARQRAIGMLLPIKKSYQLLANYGCLARDIYDKCGIVFGAVRFTRHGESEVHCARECRDDAQRSATHRRGWQIKKILREDFLSRGPLSK